MNGEVLPAIALVVGVPFFGVYPAYLSRKGRLSMESLVVYIPFMAWVVMMALGAFLDNGFLPIGSGDSVKFFVDNYFCSVGWRVISSSFQISENS